MLGMGPRLRFLFNCIAPEDWVLQGITRYILGITLSPTFLQRQDGRAV